MSTHPITPSEFRAMRLVKGMSAKRLLASIKGKFSHFKFANVSRVPVFSDRAYSVSRLSDKHCDPDFKIMGRVYLWANGSICCATDKGFLNFVNP